MNDLNEKMTQLCIDFVGLIDRAKELLVMPVESLSIMSDLDWIDVATHDREVGLYLDLLKFGVEFRKMAEECRKTTSNKEE